MKVIFYNKQGNEIERADVNSEADARLRALALGWFYEIQTN